MGVFDRQIATAKRLIAKNGEACIWRVLVPGAPTIPGQAWKPTQPIEADIPKHNVEVCWVPESTINNLFDTVVPVGLAFGLMCTQAFVPSIQDELQRSDSSRVKVNWLRELNPNGNESVLWAIGFGI